MNYIEQLKRQNITFDSINEAEAELIMQKKWSIYKLLNLSMCFEKYRGTSLKGQFISLDFSQLILLAEIDEALSRLLIGMCLDIERYIKSSLIYSVDHSTISNDFLAPFLEKYPNEILHSYSANSEYQCFPSYADLNNASCLIYYLDSIGFGTLINLVKFFDSNYANSNRLDQLSKYEMQLYSTKRIRNIVVHQNSVLSRLHILTSHSNLFMRTYLGNCGIGNTTLKTNMSKAIISDLVNIFYFYFKIIPDYESCYIDFLKFDEMFCQRNWNFISSNAQLSSVYFFLKEVIKNFYKKRVDRSDNECYNNNA